MLPLPPDTLAEPALLVVGAGILALLLTLVLLLFMRRRMAARRTAVAPVRPTAERPAEPLGFIDPEAITAALVEAQAEGEQKRMAPLQLSLARWNLANGEEAAAAELLRQCIRSAATAGQKETHARARVELGDIEQSGGDPTSACEHWQIARSLFHELGLKGEHVAVEARMRRNGCPTDWVLTDF